MKFTKTNVVDNVTILDAKLLNGIQDGILENGAEIIKKDTETKNLINSIKKKTLSAVIGITWLGEEAPFTQTIPVGGITKNDTPHIVPVYSKNVEEALEQKAQWGLISDGETGDGNITFYCFRQAPDIEIPIQIEVNY